MDKLEGLKKDDTVEVTFRGVVDENPTFRALYVRVENGDVSPTIFTEEDINAPSFSIKKVELPIAVGDRVEAGGKEAEVRAIVDGFYVLNSTAWEFPQVWRPENVKRA
jgi:hypothetical protein